MAILTSVGYYLDYLVNHPWIILVGLLIYGLLFSLSVFLSRPKPGKNPFYNDYRKPRKPLVTDHAARDAVLKQRFKKSKVQEKYDVIIIGSGVGGLSTAVFLSRVGKKVLVLEQHDQAGGCCHTFLEEGYEFDTGIHYVGHVHPGRENRMLIDQLTDGQLDWAPMDDAYDVVAVGDSEKPRYYPMKTGNEEYRKNLLAMFPEEAQGINKWVDMLNAERKKMLGSVILKILPMKWAKILTATRLIHLITGVFKKQRSLQEVVESCTSNKELQLVMSYIFGDYGVIPSEAPFFLHSLIVNHYRGGAFYPVGGSSEVAMQMIPIIERSGGRVLVCAPVTKILFDEKGCASGVAVEKTSGDIEIKASLIISSAGIVNTLKTLVPREIASKTHVYKMLDKQTVVPSCSYISAFVGIKGNSKDLNLKSQNIWYYNGTSIDDQYKKYMSLSASEVAAAEVPMLFISFPSAKDPSWDDRYPGKAVALILTLCKYEWFKEWEEMNCKHRGDDYEGFKNVIGKRMLQHLLNMYPQIEDKIDYFEVGSPLTNKFYLGQPEGEMYGLNHNKQRFEMESSLHLRPDIGIPGLLLTGQDVLICGLTGALFGTMITVSRILNRNMFGDLKKLQQKVKKKD